MEHGLAAGCACCIQFCTWTEGHAEEHMILVLKGNDRNVAF